MAGKIRFSGAQKSMLLKGSSEEHCAPCDFMWYTCSHHFVPRHALNEIFYGKMKQCSNILQFPYESAETLSEKKKQTLLPTINYI